MIEHSILVFFMFPAGPMMKVLRPVVLKKHAKLIEGLYEE